MIGPTIGPSISGDDSDDRQRIEIRRIFAPQAGKLRARLYEQGVVLGEQASEAGGWLLTLELWSDELEVLVNTEGCQLIELYPLHAVSNA